MQQIGCPYAAHEKWVEIDYPVPIEGIDTQKVKLSLKGCSFCDVAVDKGFYDQLDIATAVEQIRCLPETAEGGKIPFELIIHHAPGLGGLDQRGGVSKDFFLTIHKLDIINPSINLHTLFS